MLETDYSRQLGWNVPGNRKSLDLEREYQNTVKSYSAPHAQTYKMRDYNDITAVGQLDPSDYITPEEREVLCKADFSVMPRCWPSVMSQTAGSAAQRDYKHWSLVRPNTPTSARKVDAGHLGGFLRANSMEQLNSNALNLSGARSSSPQPRVKVEHRLSATEESQGRQLWGADNSRNPVTPTNLNYPTEQVYELTQLMKSKVRLNDELAPRPTQVDMTRINSAGAGSLTFPAEHPFASHQPRYAVFPSFSQTPENPDTGLAARASQPKPPNIPARPDKLDVLSKITDSARRHELFHLQSSTRQAPIKWPGDSFNQIPKCSGGRTVYPIPPKLVKPNMEPRPPGVPSLSPSSAQTLANIERGQWRTHYSREFTGQSSFGSDSARPNNNDKLQRPQSAPVSQRVRSQQTATQQPSPAALSNVPVIEPWPLKRESTMNPTGSSNPTSLTRSAPVRLHQTEQLEQEDVSGLQAYRNRIQQAEADNRWRLLNSETPRDSLAQLRNKQGIVSRTPSSLPNTVFDHESRFQGERAGLYRTQTYLPELYLAAFNNDSALVDTSRSHENAIGYPNELMRELKLIGASLNGGTNGLLTNGPYPYYVGSPLQQPVDRLAALAEPRMQDGRFVSCESEMGSHFNVDKFLQSYELPKYAQCDPTRVLSLDNSNLNQVRQTAIPLNRSRSVHFSGDVMVAHGYGTDPIYLSSAPLNDESFRNYTTGVDEIAGRPLNNCWAPSPASTVAQIQNSQLMRSWTKTEAQRRFQGDYPEAPPDLRENMTQGRQHTFFGVNGQVMRGQMAMT